MVNIARTKDSHYLLCVPDTTMLCLVEGAQSKLKEYRRDKEDPKFADEESQEHIVYMIYQLKQFIRESEQWIVVTENKVSDCGLG